MALALCGRDLEPWRADASPRRDRCAGARRLGALGWAPLSASRAPQRLRPRNTDGANDVRAGSGIVLLARQVLTGPHTGPGCAVP